MPQVSKKRKAGSTAPAEITFDFAAREEYLTGFHKRKVQRIKLAQEENAKKNKEETLEARAEMRRSRKEDLAKHVAEVNLLLRKQAGDFDSDSSDEEEFEGFDDPPVPEEIDREDEYVDEDKYTTVTIESVGISKEGFEKTKAEKEKEAEANKPEEVKKVKRVWTKEFPKNTKPKPRKKKFRYEAPAERRAARDKQGAKNKAAASARREAKDK